MQSRIKSLFNDYIVDEACKKYKIEVETLQFIGGFQNFVYEYKQNNKEFILRFTHSSLRSKELVEAELEWILYLSDKGVSVSKPLPSTEGSLLETVDIGSSYFIISLFEKAQGKKAQYPACLHDTDLFEKCGALTGKMHRMAKTYVPRKKRHEWRQNYYLQNVANFIPSTQLQVLESYNDLMDSIMNLNQDNESYGLIHADINVGNFFVDQSSITLFDFDECQYSWFVEDIAVELYYLVYVFGDDSLNDRNMQCQRFMEYFLKGYRQENTISDYWLKQMPLFLRLREIIVYTGMHRSFDMSNLDGWTQDYLTQSKIRIENGTSIVDLLA